MEFHYPNVDKISLVEEQHGQAVPDPYRWLEDPHSEETKKFVRAQNDVTAKYLALCPIRASIKQQLEQNQDYERIDCGFKRGGKYYYSKNSGLQKQSVMYQQDSLNGKEKVFFDPNLLSEDGTVALTSRSFSHDGKWFAYGLSYSGSDWFTVNIRNVETGKDLPETLKRLRYSSLQWTHDNKGFFYASFPNHPGETAGNDTNLNEYHQIFYHELNTDQSADVLKVCFDDKPKWILGFEVSYDGSILHVFPSEGCHNNLWFYGFIEQANSNKKIELKPIIKDEFIADFKYISNNGKDNFIRTNLDAPNFKIVRVNLDQPAITDWVDIIPNHPTDVLDSAEMYTVNNQDYLLINYMRNVVGHLELYGLDGKLVRKFEMPPGSISKHSGMRDDKEIFFQFSSFLTPGKSYHFNLEKLDGEVNLLRQSCPKNFNQDNFVTKQVFYKSFDDVEVPMFITHHKDIVMDSKNPCLLYGYGGFDVSLTPSFSINRLFWLEKMRGVFAIANIRGGGEKGKVWHESGRLMKKQNCFNDFIFAAEYLIKEKYTCTDKLAIEGGSNGGLLVAAVSNQRPDLFGATICRVGVLDMLRYNKFTIGFFWMSEYGDPSKENDFSNLIKYSPYHNIPEDVDHYPAMLITTAEHDDRVVASHSLKFAAKLQEKLSKKLKSTPFLLRVETKAGHGGGMPLTKRIEETADVYSFLYNALNLSQDYKST